MGAAPRLGAGINAIGGGLPPRSRAAVRPPRGFGLPPQKEVNQGGRPAAAPFNQPQAGRGQAGRERRQLREVEQIERLAAADAAKRSGKPDVRAALEMATVNVCSLRDPKRRRERLRQLLNSQLLNHNGEIQVFCLQETWIADAAGVDELREEWLSIAGVDSWVVAAPCPDGDPAAGVAILYASRHGSPTAQALILESEHVEASGRRCAAAVRCGEWAFTVACVYAPAQAAKRVQFFANTAFFDRIDADDLVAAGDWNSCIDDHNPNGVQRRVGDGNTLRGFFRHLGATDAYRHLHPCAPGFTCVRSRAVAGDGGSDSDGDGGGGGGGSFSKTRIDTFAVSGACVNRTVRCDTAPYLASDHFAVTLRIELVAPGNSAPAWFRFPAHLSRSAVVADRVQRAANIFKELRAGGVEPGEAWVRTKVCLSYLLRGAVITTKLREQEHQRNTLRRLRDAATRIEGHRAAEVDMDAYVNLVRAETAAEVRRTVAQRLRGAPTLRRESERARTAFFNLIRRRRPRTVIRSLQTGVGAATTTSDPELIRTTLDAFYSRLFQGHLGTNPGELDKAFCGASLDKLLEHVAPRLSQEMRDMLGAPITLAELKVAALAAPPGRTPGSDGIPAELYKVHWDELGPALLELYTSAIASGELPQELTEAIVTLMLKKDSDAELPGSYRPLSLINTDYKILARVLAARLKLVIGAVCGPGQAAYVPERSIFECTETVTSAIKIMAELDSEYAEGALIFFDAEKAFDIVQHAALFDRVMARMGFGAPFIRMVKLLYKGAGVRLLVNSKLGRRLLLLRGVRQGDPLSGFLYIILGELRRAAILEIQRVNRLQQLPDRWGLQLGSALSQLTMFADDATYLLANWRYIIYVMQANALYNVSTGSRTNAKKSRLLMPGVITAAARAGARVHKLVPLGDGVVMRYLGISIGRGLTDEQRWRSVLDGLAAKIADVRKIHLSLTGRALVARVYLCSRLWYVAAAVHLPDAIVAQINRMVYNYINGSARTDRTKAGRLPRARMQRSVANGGVGAVNIAPVALANRFRVLAMVAHGRNRGVTAISTRAHFGRTVSQAVGPRAWVLPAVMPPWRSSPDAAAWKRVVFSAAKLQPAAAGPQARATNIFFNDQICVRGRMLRGTTVAEQLMIRHRITRVWQILQMLRQPAALETYEASFTAAERAKRPMVAVAGAKPRAADIHSVAAALPLPLLPECVVTPPPPGTLLRCRLPPEERAARGLPVAVRVTHLEPPNAVCEGGTVTETNAVILPGPATLPLPTLAAHYSAVFATTSTPFVTTAHGFVHEGADTFDRLVFTVRGMEIPARDMRTRHFAALLQEKARAAELSKALPLVEKWGVALGGLPLPANFVLTGGRGFFVWLSKTDLLSASQRNFMFLLMHRRLAVGSFLKHLGIAGVLGMCVWCAACAPPRAVEETTEHLMWECPATRAMWEHALTVAAVALPARRLFGCKAARPGDWSLERYRDIIFAPLPLAPHGPSHRATAAELAVWRIIRGEAIWAIWTLRNSQYSFPDKPAQPHYAVERVASLFDVRLCQRIIEEIYSPSRGLTAAHWSHLVGVKGLTLQFNAVIGGAEHELEPANDRHPR